MRTPSAFKGERTTHDSIINAMKFISSVETISLTPRHAHSAAAMPAYAPPARKPTRIARGRCNAAGRPGTYSATQVAKMPPTINWPSMPTLIRRALKATIHERATSTSGIERAAVVAACFVLPKAPSKRARAASRGGLPLTAMMASEITSPATTVNTEAAGPMRRLVAADFTARSPRRP